MLLVPLYTILGSQLEFRKDNSYLVLFLWSQTLRIVTLLSLSFRYVYILHFIITFYVVITILLKKHSSVHFDMTDIKLKLNVECVNQQWHISIQTFPHLM